MDGYWNESAQTRKTLQKGWALTDVEVYALRRDGVLQLADAHAEFKHYLQVAAEQYSAAGPA